MTDIEERLALAVLDAEGDKEKTTRLYETYSKSDATKSWVKLQTEGLIGKSGGITTDGLRCLNRGYIYSDHLLKEQERLAMENKRHQETLSVAKESNTIAKEANKIAKRAKGWSIAALVISTLISLSALGLSVFHLISSQGQ